MVCALTMRLSSDSFMAVSIVETMRNLANQGRTIVCTIHQPSSEIFEKFDMLYLMAEGRLAYLGELNRALSFFESMDFKCPSNYNPADFYIKTLAIEPNNRELCKEKVKVVNSLQFFAFNNFFKFKFLRKFAIPLNPVQSMLRC